MDDFCKFILKKMTIGTWHQVFLNQVNPPERINYYCQMHGTLKNYSPGRRHHPVSMPHATGKPVTL